MKNRPKPESSRIRMAAEASGFYTAGRASLQANALPAQSHSTRPQTKPEIPSCPQEHSSATKVATGSALNPSRPF